MFKNICTIIKLHVQLKLALLPLRWSFFRERMVHNIAFFIAKHR